MDRLFIAGTDRGACFLGLGDLGKEQTLIDEVLREYPHAVLVPGDDVLWTWTDVVLTYLDGGGDCQNVPLDFEVTPFRRQVYDALQAIPRGETRTYSAIAEALGHPTAARAVARCCATNPVSLIIPCHRVLRRDGHLGGYRWGLERKQALLKLEGAAVGPFPVGRVDSSGSSIETT